MLSAKAFTPIFSYFPLAMQAMGDQYDASANPKGFINMAVAENRMMPQHVIDKLNSHSGAPPPNYLGYQNMQGIQEMREATAKMMRATFLSGTDVKPEHLHIASGVAAVLDQLGYLVFDAGDSVLIPAPYYAAFNSDFEVRDGVSVVPVYLSADVTRNHMSNMEPAEALRQLKLALEATESKGSRVRALLLTNPGNPTGRVYSEELLRSMMQWCLDKGIHLISDEVYANAVWNPQAGPRFVSAMRIAEMIRVEHPKLAELVDDHVHVLYGMSKDFALSGARVGILYSKNRQLHTALGKLSIFAAVSNLSQWTLSQVLADTDWCTQFLEESRVLTKDVWGRLTAILDAEGIPYVPSQGAMFCWVDMRKFLKEQTWEEEERLWSVMGNNHRVVVTPGQATYAEAPGFFRLCFMWPRNPEAVEEGIRRMGAALKEYRTA